MMVNLKVNSIRGLIKDEEQKIQSHNEHINKDDSTARRGVLGMRTHFGS